MLILLLIIITLLSTIYNYKKTTNKLNKQNKYFDKNNFLLLEIINTALYMLLIIFIIKFNPSKTLVFLAFVFFFIWYLIYISIRDKTLNNK
ncbi:hypothetical protein BGI42_08870 [Clostridium taeniosporum]|uniref:Uncharacterized protein n=1 Tax=Clostridium taeniosporum TaxID=394958 RepID=A0A1D7XKH2_9CLOT|nr:hypothetical protein BGI42_08870 [Clostridium taeniosporum]